MDIIAGTARNHRRRHRDTNLQSAGADECAVDADHGGVAARTAAARRRPHCQVIVLTGAGRAFCAGGDVKSMAEGGERRSAAEATAHLRARMEVSRILYELPKPTIAMINGPAAGAGLALALACDLRVAGASGRLVTAFVRVGFSGDFGGSFFLTRLVGTAKARELYFTGRPVEADEALSLGLVNRVVPDEELATVTMELALSLAQGPSVALSLMKRN